MIGVTTLVMVETALAADVHVMISAGFYHVYSELGPAFERASGHHLVTTRGPSMGDSPESIPTRLARGEAADVVILDGGAADALAKRGLLRTDSKIELARSLTGKVSGIRSALQISASAPYSISTMKMPHHCVSNNTACASCHQQKNAFVDPNRFSKGHQGKFTDRHVCTIIRLGSTCKMMPLIMPSKA
jgi:hypothetical protein